MTDDDLKRLRAEMKYYNQRGERSFAEYLKQVTDHHEYDYVTLLAELYPEMNQFKSGSDVWVWAKTNIRLQGERDRLEFHWFEFHAQKADAWEQFTKLTEKLAAELQRRSRKSQIQKAILELRK